mmetsp:Transcript_22643/g.89579  ORF Transcript_22643/g.89579 Transcript_22643/m.89579 type:complete len:214 (+) Transcript_22643:137-778(+)
MGRSLVWWVSSGVLSASFTATSMALMFDVSPEGFFTFLTVVGGAPLAVFLLGGLGDLPFESLLFLPKRPPFFFGSFLSESFLSASPFSGSFSGSSSPEGGSGATLRGGGANPPRPAPSIRVGSNPAGSVEARPLPLPLAGDAPARGATGGGTFLPGMGDLSRGATAGGAFFFSSASTFSSSFEASKMATLWRCGSMCTSSTMAWRLSPSFSKM